MFGIDTFFFLTINLWLVQSSDTGPDCVRHVWIRALLYQGGGGNEDVGLTGGGRHSTASWDVSIGKILWDAVVSLALKQYTLVQFLPPWDILDILSCLEFKVPNNSLLKSSGNDVYFSDILKWIKSRQNSRANFLLVLPCSFWCWFSCLALVKWSPASVTCFPVDFVFVAKVRELCTCLWLYWISNCFVEG